MKPYEVTILFGKKEIVFRKVLPKWPGYGKQESRHQVVLDLARRKGIGPDFIVGTRELP
jgi:hypothetical protein